MAENDQNDEYRFVELDGLDNNLTDDADPNSGDSSYARQTESPKKDIKRNAIIAIALILFLMLMYKILGYLFFSKTEEVAVEPVAQIPAQFVAQPTQPQPVINTAPPVVTKPVISVDNSELTKKVAAMELMQQNVRADLGTVGQQVSSVNSNIQNLNNQIAGLNQVINNLSTQLAKQSEEINVLMTRTQPKKVVHHVSRPSAPPIHYYIQAVIPGRAWIIASNGSTLTVREGTKIAGYGIVKLIDPLDGRVVMSSGQVIRFSQEDS